MDPFRVLFVASEVAPFRKTGGLADVVGALPPALARRGMDVRVVMPLYGGVHWDDLEALVGSVTVPTSSGEGRAGVRLGWLHDGDVPVYFLEHHRYFDRPDLYGPPGDAYGDNLERFAFLSRGALRLCHRLGFEPDVVHAHDWQTALVPVYLNTVEWGSPLHAAASVFTLHNLAYQGTFDRGALPVTGLGPEHDNPLEFEHFGSINLVKAAIRHSTMLSTVSPNYAREIRSRAHGFGLDGEIAARGGDLRGILNGIDVAVWNPATDPWIAMTYDASRPEGKAVCKAALQAECGLATRADLPVFCAVGRLVHQKGFDVLAEALARVLTWNVQVVLLGTGEPDLERRLLALAARQPDRLAVRIGFDDALAHRIEAGGDFFLMPSRFEPCGLNQMYSLRYGTLPIVRATGGLVDTVEPYDEATGEGTGFAFADLDASALADTVGWAVSTWYDRPAHVARMRARAMTRDYSWERAAAEYERLYIDACTRRRGHAHPRRHRLIAAGETTDARG